MKNSLELSSKGIKNTQYLIRKTTKPFDFNLLLLYQHNCLEHYIMTNLERTKAVWMADNYECSITGKFSIEEAEKMIDSIYER